MITLSKTLTGNAVERTSSKLTARKYKVRVHITQTVAAGVRDFYVLNIYIYKYPLICITFLLGKTR